MESPQLAAPKEEGEAEGDDREGKSGGVREPLDSPARLAALRKKVLKSLLEQLYLVEMAGGMRSICFMKVYMHVLMVTYTHSYGYAGTVL